MPVQRTALFLHHTPHTTTPGSARLQRNPVQPGVAQRTEGSHFIACHGETQNVRAVMTSHAHGSPTLRDPSSCDVGTVMGRASHALREVMALNAARMMRWGLGSDFYPNLRAIAQ